MNEANHAYVASPDWVRRTDYDIDSSNHHYIVLSFLHKWMLERSASAASGRLLDYGCGGQPYRAIFEPIVESYVAADVAAYGDQKLDVLLVPNERLPLPDCSFDTILASQTLEHVPDPAFYIGECARPLRPGGVLILTAYAVAASRNSIRLFSIHEIRNRKSIGERRLRHCREGVHRRRLCTDRPNIA